MITLVKFEINLETCIEVTTHLPQMYMCLLKKISIRDILTLELPHSEIDWFYNFILKFLILVISFFRNDFRNGN